MDSRLEAVEASSSSLQAPNGFSPLLVTFHDSTKGFLCLLGGHQSTSESSGDPLRVSNYFCFLYARFLLRLPRRVFPLGRRRPCRRRGTSTCASRQQVRRHCRANDRRSRESRSSRDSYFRGVSRVFHRLRLLCHDSRPRKTSRDGQDREGRVVREPTAPTNGRVPGRSYGDYSCRLPRLVLRGVPPLRVDR